MTGRPKTAYFIRGERSGLVKIGKSNSPRNRLATLATASAEPLTLLAVGGDEAQYHERFASDRVHGEWFRSSPAMMALIAELGIPSAKDHVDIRDIEDVRRGRRLQIWRICNDFMTSKELSRRLECTTGWLSRVETGKRRPSWHLAGRIEQVTGIPTVDWFPPETPAQPEGRGE